jgi:hypothetical protein
MSVIAIDLHGLTVHVECRDGAVLDAIDSRLAHLPRAAAETPDLVVRYDLNAPRHVPPADARLVYASPTSQALYSPAEDAFYASHEDGATLRCSPRDGRAEIAAATAATTRLWVLTRPLLTLALMELSRARGLYPLHAACLARGTDGVLVVGPSGSGKSSLALAFLEAGYDYVSEDLVFLREERDRIVACGFPDELGLTEDVGSLFPALGDLAIVQLGWPKARADVRDAAPDVRILPSCTPAVLVVLDERASEVEELTTDETLVELLPSMLLTSAETCRRHVAAFAAAAATARCLRLPARPDLEATLELVAATLPTTSAARKEAIR